MIFGQANARVGSVYFDAQMGMQAFGQLAGCISVYETQPTNTLYTPSTLRYCFPTNDQCVVLYDSGYRVRQLKTPDGLINVVTNSALSYTMSFYPDASVGAYSAGSYPFSGSPAQSVTVSNPDGTGNTSNSVQFVEQSGRTNLYQWITNGWQVISGGGFFTQKVTETTNSSAATRTVTREVRQNTSNLVSSTATTLKWLGSFERKTQEIIGDGSTSITNWYTYSTNGTPESVTNADGSWVIYQNDAQDRPTNIFYPFLNQASTTNTSLVRWISRDYTTNVVSGSGDDISINPEQPRREVEQILGQETRRQYWIYLDGETRQITCVNPGVAWNDTSNLVTITKYVNDGSQFQGWMQSRTEANATLTTCSYTTNSSGYMTNTTAKGEADGGGTNVVKGTRTTVVSGPRSEPVSVTVVDIESGLTLSSETYADYDPQCRPRKTTFLDGTFVWTDFGCCGPTTTTNRDGLVTTYTQDALFRTAASTERGITTTNLFDADGNQVGTGRWGTNGTYVAKEGRLYDSQHRVLAVTNALNQVTSLAYGLTNGQAFTLTTFPDGNTKTERRFKDGRLDRTTGTAVHGVRSDYGVESESGVQRFYTQRIALDASGNDTSEWTKTYEDMLGRAYKTSFSDGSFSQKTFNTKGQLVKAVDPDGVTTLYQYNGRGELEYTAQDVDRNGTIDFSSTDRIARTERLVSTNHGFNVIQTRTYAWATNSSSVSNLMNLSEQSTDGLRTWNTAFNQTKTSVRGTPTGSSWTVTDTAPDGSYSVTLYQQARLASVARFDSNGVQIASLSYSYDAQGRQSLTTDARNGSTIQTFNDADQVVSTTTPMPGTGQSAQTTSFEYDSMGRMIRMVYPDSTSMTNEYHPTGELKKTYGSRTYPVEYTYDDQGRMKSVKTWKDFTGNSGTATTTWNYDGYRGFLTNKAYADGLGPNYTYTAGGKLKARAWVRGITTTYVTNSIGEVVTIDYSDSTPDVSFTFDRLGRKTTLSQGGNTNEFLYNDAGQVISEKSTAGTLSGLALTNTYDTFLRRNSSKAVVVSPASTLIAMTYGYDAASRPTSVTNGSYSATYSYVANSPLVGQIVFRDSTTTRMTTSKTYDSLNRLLSISSATTTPVSSYAYQYNDANQRTRIDMVDGSFWSYEYDKLGQVISGKRYWADGTPVPGQQYEYAFDDIGNRSSTKSGGDGSGQNLRSATYGANTLNQYTNRTISAYIQSIGAAHPLATVTVNGQSTARKGEYFEAELSVNNASTEVYTSVTNLATYGTSGTNIGNLFTPKTPEVFSYDADGNLTNDGRWVYTWDGENRLTKMESQSSAPTASKRKVVYGYDYQSRMIARTGYTNSGSSYGVSTDTKFVFDGWRQVVELNAASNNLVRGLTWGMDLSGSMEGAGGIGGLLMFTDAATSATHFTSYDGNGNVTSLVKASDASKTADYDYSPFGEVIRASGAMASSNPFRFSTKYQDDATDLSYYGYRFYNACTGRWASRDPIAERGGGNLYGFVVNNPIGNVDKLGEQCCLTTYRPGKYGGTPPNYPPHWSPEGHSVLKCDNGAYVSFWPLRGPDPASQWHDPDSDSKDYANGPKPSIVCLSCLDEAAVLTWLNNAKQGIGFCNRWSWGNECADATTAAIGAALPQPQVKPKCPCSRDFYTHWEVRDVLDGPNIITLPSSMPEKLRALSANGCQRYKCVAQLRTPRDGNQ
ncbi:MAG: RHS repeat-associated core domain-containing protein [Verrucomicrobia bacterium]|nr:RHS repeat-associated core domain-containing protein [Verrucomicrobiota bacterium]